MKESHKLKQIVVIYTLKSPIAVSASLDSVDIKMIVTDVTPFFLIQYNYKVSFPSFPVFSN